MPTAFYGLIILLVLVNIMWGVLVFRVHQRAALAHHLAYQASIGAAESKAIAKSVNDQQISHIREIADLRRKDIGQAYFASRRMA